MDDGKKLAGAVKPFWGSAPKPAEFPDLASHFLMRSATALSQQRPRRILRHAILHAKSRIKLSKRQRPKVVGEMFPPDEPIVIGYEEMHRLFILVKQDRARLMYAWVVIDNPPVPPEHLVDFAIQRGKPSTPMA